MAEVKNNFLGAKMNKDIDDRILPKNEYRNAINLQINKSENSDVGSLQNVLGNELVVDFNTLTGSGGLECIGYFADTANNRVFLFLTNYNDTSATGTYWKDAKNYIYEYDVSQNISSTNPKKLVEGAFLNFSKNKPIIGVNLLEDLLFFTDNRNQPRKINVFKAYNSSTYYINEDQISVAKVNPVYAIELYDESTEAPGEYETTMYDVVNEFLPDGVANPYYNPDFIGDPTYLEDKFVRFSYRYKFEENEYSIFAPFTQVAYIPKQDGYFMYEPNPNPLLEPIVDDETAAYRSTVVSFMYNKVNNILLQLVLPCPANQLQSLFKISEIEILYKESDGLAVQVVDVITSAEIVTQVGSGYAYVYNYQSKKPFKTLPERETTRVYDKTPVRALGQEIISNRVVYSNYQDKNGYPKFLNYNVACDDKSEFDPVEKTTSIIEYPNHSVKQNRNYQVGVILSDRFGRQSGVILSNSTTTFNPSFGASSLYVPYKKDNPVGSGIPSGEIVNQWPGYSLKVLFNDTINGGLSTVGWPGIYNGDPTSDDYNPLGWYSYKIVVKQTEQDYYNVYLPGVMAAYPTDGTQELGKTSHIVLIGDNINKVPRDLNEVSSTQEQYRSSVRLYARVNNVTDDWQNEQYYPYNTSSFVNTIATNTSLFTPPTTLPAGYEQFYQVDSNPLIGRLTTPSQLGTIAADGKVIRLAIYETEPFDSRLDIYWETSTSGIISELNEEVISGSGAPYGITNWDFTLNEGFDVGQNVVTDFYFSDILGDLIAIPFGDVSLNVLNSLGDQRTAWFNLVPGSGFGDFTIETNDYFYYGFNANVLETYTFNFTVNTYTPNPITTYITKNGSLENIAPQILDGPTETVSLQVGVIDIWQFNGLNGSNIGGNKETDDLTWSLIDSDPNFSITSTGLLQQISGDIFPGLYEITVRLTDAGGLYDDFIIEVNMYGELEGVWYDILTGGPFVTETQESGTWSVTGFINVLDGYTVNIRAGAFPTGSGEVESTVNIQIGGTWYDLNKLANGYTEAGYSPGLITLSTGSFEFEVYVNYTSPGGSGGLYAFNA